MTELRIDERNWSIEQAADIVGCGRTSFYLRFIMPKKIKTARIGRRVVIPGAELKRLVARIAKSAT